MLWFRLKKYLGMNFFSNVLLQNTTRTMLFYFIIKYSIAVQTLYPTLPTSIIILVIKGMRNPTRSKLFATHVNTHIFVSLTLFKLIIRVKFQVLNYLHIYFSLFPIILIVYLGFIRNLIYRFSSLFPQNFCIGF